MKTIQLISLFFIFSITFSCEKGAKKNENIEYQDSISTMNSNIDSVNLEEAKNKVVNADSILNENKNVVASDTKIKDSKKPTNDKVVKTTPTTVNNSTNVAPKINTEPKTVVVENKVVDKEKPEEKVVETPKEPVVVNTNTSTSTTSNANTSSWVVPSKDKSVKNPLEYSKDNAAEGKALYIMHCRACHGSKGLGDGTKAKGLKGDLGDFSSGNFQSQTDGELFYKTKKGRDDMPGYAKKMSDEDIWLTVIFIRSLKK